MSETKLILGDCLENIKNIPDNTVDTIITDPPYGLSNHTQEEVTACILAWATGQEYCPKGSGFMGKTWDAWVPSPTIWKECFRVLKPGGMCLVFAGTRSMDLMGLSLRLAGFEFRDSIGYLQDCASILAWVQGQGFPKSLNMSKAIDKLANIEGKVIPNGNPVKRIIPGADQNKTGSWIKDNGQFYQPGKYEPASEAAKQWEGYGTQLKPAFEPILLCMKPCEGTFAENALKWGVAGLNIDGCRVDACGDPQLEEKYHSVRNASARNNAIYGKDTRSRSEGNIEPHPAGRWPANVVHDGSEEVLAEFPNSGSGNNGEPFQYSGREYDNKDTSMFNGDKPQAPSNYNDRGSASRFFYCAKASASDRNTGLPAGQKNTHCTVKPLALMKYLCTLTKTPTGGIVLDPFMGSGTTGVACKMTGRGFIGIEKEKEYFEIAQTRIQFAKDKKEKEVVQPSLFE